MYLLKVYAIVNELEELHRLSEAADFIALHLTAFFERFEKSILAFSRKIFIFSSESSIEL